MGFDFRAALENRLQIPVVYNNDGNAAALYAHVVHFGVVADERSSVSAIVGTGLGGGVIEMGTIVKGAAGMAGELGHVHIPMDGLVGEGQPTRAATAASPATPRASPPDRHHPQPAAVLAEPVPRPRAAPGRVARQGREAGARVRRAG